MQPLLTQLLDIPGMAVEDYHNTDNALILEVRADRTRAVCPRCGQESTQLHQNHRHRVRDLSISQHRVFLTLNRRQFKCAECRKPFSEAFEFVGKRREYTDRFAEMIVQQVRHSDMHNVGVNHGLTDEQVASMVQYVSKKNASGRERVATIGNR
ncbi:MAG: transposase [Leptolyngbya sp. UWPOB_LEPTO1]|uniref:transposase family protein n=1 Tax=Leptolyngbya sp. UWPOB_LEPTO1 TaxID=2815653 RepID=UPI001ACEC469|nr:transposase family protein [Leptolyngbya sp. UWPOB_LEPTO1]MBN8560194.1 transposase [Leptolyngbya sp. UWPOB_LEPTO1]